MIRAFFFPVGEGRLSSLSYNNLHEWPSSQVYYVPWSQIYLFTYLDIRVTYHLLWQHVYHLPWSHIYHLHVPWYQGNHLPWSQTTYLLHWVNIYLFKCRSTTHVLPSLDSITTPLLPNPNLRMIKIEFLITMYQHENAETWNLED